MHGQQRETTVKQEITQWNMRVPKPLDMLVEQALKKGVWTNRSEFIRLAVVEKLERLQLL